jgi:ankyrin repeat protein
MTELLIPLMAGIIGFSIASYVCKTNDNLDQLGGGKEETKFIRENRNGNILGVKKMLAKGINSNVTNYRKYTALHFASRNENIGLVKLLLQHQANPNLQDNSGKTPLHIACWKGNASIIKLLLEHGADTNIKDENEITPLHSACTKNIDSVKILIKHGANIDVLDANNDTPLNYALYHGNTEIAQFLIDIEYNRIKGTPENKKLLWKEECHKKNPSQVKLLAILKYFGVQPILMHDPIQSSDLCNINLNKISKSK